LYIIMNFRILYPEVESITQGYFILDINHPELKFLAHS
jgi:hypothetical protein